MTTGSPPSMTATQLLVVPRSMPMILPMTNSFLKMRVEELAQQRGNAVAVDRLGEQRDGACLMRRLVESLVGAGAHQDGRHRPVCRDPVQQFEAGHIRHID